MTRRRRLILAGIGAMSLLLTAVPAALGSFHLMKVREVFPDGSNDDYIELQMTAAGQNLVGGHSVTVYNSTGDVTSMIPLSHVANGANQATILIGDINVMGADFSEDSLDVGAAGAACWDAGTPPDCVTWGSFIQPLMDFQNPQTANFADPAGITSGMAIRRTIARGCPTALDAADDTDDSAADFAEGAPLPRNNASLIPEMACLLPPVMNQPSNPGPTSNPSAKKKKKKCKKAKKKKGAAAAKKCKKKKKKK